MLTAYSKTTSIHRDHRQTVSLFCDAHKIGRKLRAMWFQHIQHDWILTHGLSTGAVLGQFSYNLHGATLQAIHANTLRSCPMFKQATSVLLRYLLRHCKYEAVLAKSLLIKEGQQCNRLYILANGVIQASHAKSAVNLRESYAVQKGNGRTSPVVESASKPPPEATADSLPPPSPLPSPSSESFPTRQARASCQCAQGSVRHVRRATPSLSPASPPPSPPSPAAPFVNAGASGDGGRDGGGIRSDCDGGRNGCGACGDGGGGSGRSGYDGDSRDGAGSSGEGGVPLATRLRNDEGARAAPLLVGAVLSEAVTCDAGRSSPADSLGGGRGCQGNSSSTLGVRFDAAAVSSSQLDGQRTTAACHRELTSAAKAARDLADRLSVAPCAAAAGSHSSSGAIGSAGSKSDPSRSMGPQGATVGPRSERYPASERGGCGSGEARGSCAGQRNSACGVFGEHTRADRKDQRNAHAREQTKAWKSKVRENAIIERAGSMLGFSDPFLVARPSVYTATAWSRVETMVYERHVLVQALQYCREEDTLRVCRAIETEYNKLMMRLKAKEHTESSVKERQDAGDADQFRRQSLEWMADFSQADHLARTPSPPILRPRMTVSFCKQYLAWTQQCMPCRSPSCYAYTLSHPSLLS